MYATRLKPPVLPTGHPGEFGIYYSDPFPPLNIPSLRAGSIYRSGLLIFLVLIHDAIARKNHGTGCLFAAAASEIHSHDR